MTIRYDSSLYRFCESVAADISLRSVPDRSAQHEFAEAFFSFIKTRQCVLRMGADCGDRALLATESEYHVLNHIA